MNTEPNVILALYPNTRGLGYACIDMPEKLLDAGVMTVKPVSNEPIIARVTSLIAFHRPTSIVLRDCANGKARCSNRIKELLQLIHDAISGDGIPVHRYTRMQIRDVFEVWGASTKYEIAGKILVWFPELNHRAPRIRKPWMDEDYNMGIFDAIALAATHEYLK